jgi:hypothetical protein
MGTAKCQDVSRAAFTAIERKFLAHDFDGLCVAGGKIFGAIDGLPEAPHIPPGKRAEPRVRKIPVLGYFPAG